MGKHYTKMTFVVMRDSRDTGRLHQPMSRIKS